jgi:hypothetical protein
VAVDLAAGIGAFKEARVAVLALPDQNNCTNDGSIVIADRLAHCLAANKKITVLERGQMIDILREYHLSESGLLDPKTAKRIGQILSANVIVTGTLIDLTETKAEINARAILADGGRVIAASRVQLEPNWQRPRRLGW